jgi:hypothetical protein
MSDTTRALAEQVPGLTTGEHLSAPANPKARRFEPLQPFEVEAWPRNRLAAFALLAPVALYTASTERPVSVALLAREGEYVYAQDWIGGSPAAWGQREREGVPHNEPKGCWPVKIGLSGAHKDTVTRSLRNADPYVPWALRRRVWLKGLDYSDDGPRLLQEVTRVLSEAAHDAGHARLLGGAIDAGVHFSPYRFERGYVRRLAGELGVHVWWSDGDLAEFLVRAMRRSVDLGIGRREEPFRQMCLQLIEEDRAKGALQPVREEVRRVPGKEAQAAARGYQAKQPVDERAVEEWRREKGLGRG